MPLARKILADEPNYLRAQIDLLRRLSRRVK